MTDYYDVALKRRRHQMLLQHERFAATEAMLEDAGTLMRRPSRFAPDIIVHLAAQAGVRYSIENPRAYVDANVTGTFNVLEAAREQGVRHLLMASTSSVYGANEEMPFRETDKADTQVSLYAATKKAGEAMGHVYAHLWGIPTTMFRFFTVYGPWGRPDLALFKFTDAILDGRPDRHLQPRRDVPRLHPCARPRARDPGPDGRGARAAGASAAAIPEGDSLSPVAPFRIVNIGNSEKVRLLDFVEAIEEATGRKAMRNYMDMQPGDVPATWADASLLQALTGYRPATDFREGMREFVAWFRDYYGK
jgi:UDP-glucuronate 4-epimerase